MKAAYGEISYAEARQSKSAIDFCFLNFFLLCPIHIFYSSREVSQQEQWARACHLQALCGAFKDAIFTHALVYAQEHTTSQSRLHIKTHHPHARTQANIRAHTRSRTRTRTHVWMKRFMNNWGKMGTEIVLLGQIEFCQMLESNKVLI